LPAILEWSHSITNMASFHLSVVYLLALVSIMTRRRRVRLLFLVTEYSLRLTHKLIMPQTCRHSQKCWRRERASDRHPCLWTHSSSPLVLPAAAPEASAATKSNLIQTHNTMRATTHDILGRLAQMGREILLLSRFMTYGLGNWKAIDGFEGR